MTKRIYNLILIAILALVPSMKSMAVNIPVGNWTTYPIYTGTPQKVIDTQNMVYYLASGNLYSYDKTTHENYSYSPANVLSETDIRNVYYNFDRNYLLIAYTSGNIDLLYDGNEVYNMSDISDAMVTPPLIINDVAFDGDNIYVATSFGIVKFSESKKEVVESGIYYANIPGLAILEGRVVIYHDKEIKILDQGKSIRSFSNFVTLYPVALDLVDFDSEGERLLVEDRFGNVYTFLFNLETLTRLITKAFNDTTASKFIKSPNTVYITASNKLYRLDADHTFHYVVDLPEQLVGNALGIYGDESSMWGANNMGLTNVGVSDGTVTVYADRMDPNGMITKDVQYIVPSTDGKHIYANTHGKTVYKFGNSRTGIDIVQTTTKLNMETGKFSNANGYPVQAESAVSKSRQNIYGKYVIDPLTLVPDPDDPNSYYIACYNDGIYRITNGEKTAHYTGLNAPFVQPYGWVMYTIAIDRGGNLWVACPQNTSLSQGQVCILPAAKRRQDSSTISASDWIVIADPDFRLVDDATFLVCQKSNMIFLFDNSTKYTLIAFDTKGTFNDLSDDKYYVHRVLTDQDSKEYNNMYKLTMHEDKEGKVWLGTSLGIFEIATPSNATSPMMRVNHVKVPRNDGTNIADYLLGSDLNNSISSDPANRKWIATDASGLYLVSPSGDEIIRHFTMDNSPLPSNRVNSVYADPNSNNVYIGTPYGMLCYSSDATAPQEDYSNVYAFPNPVRPDYTGPIYVKGLMEGSLVKIADSAGNVVSQGKSEGGMYEWDGCNFNGSRVKSGVYYVFLSQNSGGSSSGAVAKILVVN